MVRMLAPLIVVSNISSAAAETKITQDQVEQARSKKDRAVHRNDITVTAKLDSEPKPAVPIKQRYEMLLVVARRQPNHIVSSVVQSGSIPSLLGSSSKSCLIDMIANTRSTA